MASGVKADHFVSLQSTWWSSSPYPIQIPLEHLQSPLVSQLPKRRHRSRWSFHSSAQHFALKTPRPQFNQIKAMDNHFWYARRIDHPSQYFSQLSEENCWRNAESSQKKEKEYQKNQLERRFVNITYILWIHSYYADTTSQAINDWTKTKIRVN